MGKHVYTNTAGMLLLTLAFFVFANGLGVVYKKQDITVSFFSAAFSRLSVAALTVAHMPAALLPSYPIQEPAACDQLTTLPLIEIVAIGGQEEFPVNPVAVIPKESFTVTIKAVGNGGTLGIWATNAKVWPANQIVVDSGQTVTWQLTPLTSLVTIRPTLQTPCRTKKLERIEIPIQFGFPEQI